jgi:hypothetical protein
MWNNDIFKLNCYYTIIVTEKSLMGKKRLIYSRNDTSLYTFLVLINFKLNLFKKES